MVWAKVRSSFLETPAGQRRRLVDDGRGPGLADGLAYRARVEQVEQDRLRTERPDPLAVTGRGERADHFVPLIGQLGNEPGADRTAGPDDHDPHAPDSFAPAVWPAFSRATQVTPGRAGM